LGSDRKNSIVSANVRSEVVVKNRRSYVIWQST